MKEDIISQTSENTLEENIIIEPDGSKTRTTDLRENAIEWYNGQQRVTATFSQRRHINTIMNLAEKYPNEVTIDTINQDGTVLAHFPLSYLRIQRPREMTPEQKEKATQRLQQYWKNKE